MSELEAATWRYVDKTCPHLDPAERAKVVAKVLKNMKRTLAVLNADAHQTVENKGDYQ